jgi:hypothetical protein
MLHVHSISGYSWSPVIFNQSRSPKKIDPLRNTGLPVLICCFASKVTFNKSIDIEYRVSDYKIQKSIGVSISNTGIEVSDYRMSNTEKSIGCPALAIIQY